MININFVPDDYVRNNESKRTNVIYIFLFVVVMVALSGSFFTIKYRKKMLNDREKTVDSELAQRKGEIEKVQQLQDKRNQMWSRALITAELIEPVSKSLLLASLTNNLPNGVSLLKLNLIQKESEDPLRVGASTATTKYQSLKNSGAKASVETQSLEKGLETHIDIEGIAPSDLEVAAYIERLGNSMLITNVALVESREFEAKNSKSKSPQKFRHFKLTAMLNNNVELTSENIKLLSDSGV
jgi:Tfp pilus assembly protein PilN